MTTEVAMIVGSIPELEGAVRPERPEIGESSFERAFAKIVHSKVDRACFA